MSAFGSQVSRAGRQIFEVNERAAEEADRRRRQDVGFQVETQKAQLLIDAGQKAMEIDRDGPANGDGLVNAVDADISTRLDRLVQSVPPDMRAQVKAELAPIRARTVLSAAAQQNEKRTGWFKSNISEAQRIATQQAHDAPDQFEQARATVYGIIDKSDLPEPEKLKARRDTDAALGGAVYTAREMAEPGSQRRRLGIAPEAPAGVTMTGGEFERGQSIASYYRNKGLSPVASAAIAGHFVQENGGRFTGRPGDSGTAFGAAQWREERFEGLQQFAAQRGTTWEDPQTQLDYVEWEGLNGDAGARRAWNELQNAKTLEDATEAMMHFERPQGYQPHSPRGGHGWDNRLRNAREILGGGRQPAGGRDIPVVSAGHVKMDGVDAIVLDRWKAVQNQFGRQLTITSGHRDRVYNKRVGGADKSQHIHGNAIDVSVKGMSKEDRVHLISLASSMGFTGIGVYENSLHLDTGPRRSWGPSYGGESIPAWAKGVLDAHNAGQVEATAPGPLASRDYDLAPEYSGLSFADRLQLAQQSDRAGAEAARSALAQQKAQLEAYTSSLDVRALNFDLTEAEVLADPNLTDADRAPLLRTVRSVANDVSAGERAFADYQNGAMRDLNPLDSDERAVADKAYSTMLKSLSGAAPELVQQQTETFIRNTGIIPQRVQADIRAGFYAKDPALLAAAAGQAVAIQKAAPLAFETMPNGEQVLRDLTTFRTLVEGRNYTRAEAAQEILDQRSDAYHTAERMN
ncbi:phage tail tip lysozyme [Antarcticirhabdus aurantiaca]|uniref:Phage tail tip lysozyme n=1 Tax=Antarcticirhabdus aurantiaca TaxID=2606717 RepID=A0ACD4NMC9_9HYPH|nr:phage tail tip lysozyme [Antarcticirhabdus aurantiaca]WAJ28031.1 phage tail tip lysozyme [Jeongeuplla avenae]